tara:strand:- start:284 stop:388 length:105 start_codon:yes stop_codon:yes gene_type:complete
MLDDGIMVIVKDGETPNDGIVVIVRDAEMLMLGV